MLARPVARLVPLHHIQPTILITHVNTKGSFINHVTIKPRFYELLGKTNVLID